MNRQFEHKVASQQLCALLEGFGERGAESNQELGEG